MNGENQAEKMARLWMEAIGIDFEHQFPWIKKRLLKRCAYLVSNGIGDKDRFEIDMTPLTYEKARLAGFSTIESWLRHNITQIKQIKPIDFKGK